MPARNVDAGKEGRELRRAGRVRDVGGAAHDKRQRDSGCSLLSRHALFNMSGVEGWRLGGGGTMRRRRGRGVLGRWGMTFGSDIFMHHFTKKQTSLLQRVLVWLARALSCTACTGTARALSCTACTGTARALLCTACTGHVSVCAVCACTGYVSVCTPCTCTTLARARTVRPRER